MGISGRGCAWKAAGAVVRFPPQRQLHPVTEPQLVIDHSQVVFDHVFGGAYLAAHISIGQARSHAVNDLMFTRREGTVSVFFFRIVRLVRTA